MIVSFGDKETERLYHGRGPRKHFSPSITNVALRKLDMLNAARRLEDLRSPPGNRLEALRGDRLGFHSIRVNQQWRIVFRWADSDAHDVVITDYHD